MRRNNEEESAKSKIVTTKVETTSGSTNVITRKLFDHTTRKFSSVVVGSSSCGKEQDGEYTKKCSHDSEVKEKNNNAENKPDKKLLKEVKQLKPSPSLSQSKVSNIQSQKSTQMNFCNNCGRNGHIFQQCKQPITSIGIIAFRYNSNNVSIPNAQVNPEDKYEFLMINRQHSLGYVEFMRGKYPVYNFDYLINIFNEMTISEKEKIKNNSFSQLWKDLWGEFIGQQYRNEEKTSREKFNILKNGVDIGGSKEKYSLDTLIINSNVLVQWKDTEWGFPKGRRNFQEKDLACAYREFEEETGYTKRHLHLIQNVIPFEEIFTGSNMKSYKHKYFLAYMEPESSTCSFPSEYYSSEVGEMKWLTFEECKAKIRPYNVEKLDILQKINTLLHNFSIHYAIQ